MNLVIVDYGVGNLSSIKNILKKIGTTGTISSDKNVIENADKLILPGVGAFDTCSQKLQQSGFIDILNEKVVTQKTPILGICVGMQLLLNDSEEGSLKGLGWIKGRNVRFKKESLPDDLKIPHMGWSDVFLHKPSRLFDDMYPEPRFYFVHSYHPEVTSDEDILVYAKYGYRFAAGLEHENIAGVQFHPEKSHKFGIRLFQNFVKNF